MAIDMTTVKAISYNNKDVVKIEDSLGHILWQISTPPTPTDEPIFLSRDSTQYKLENNTISSQTWSDLTSFRGNGVWSDGTNICYTQSSTTTTSYKLDTTTNTWSSFTTNISLAGNLIYSDGNGGVYYSNGSSHYELDKTTGNWSGFNWKYVGTGTKPTFTGNLVVKINNKFYVYSANYILELDFATKTMTNLNAPSAMRGNGFNVWTDGTNYYFSSNNTQRIIDIDNMTYTNVTWNGFTNVNGARVIRYDGKIICQNPSSPYNFYELDTSTNTWSSYSFSGSTITNAILDNAWNYKGRWSGGCNCVAVSKKN